MKKGRGQGAKVQGGEGVGREVGQDRKGRVQQGGAGAIKRWSRREGERS